MSTSETLRPIGLWTGDRFEFGLEVSVEDGKPVAWKPTDLDPNPVWLAPSFVNAHSHLEYRYFQGQLNGMEYWPWIRELTRLKRETPLEAFEEACMTAAAENRATGVGLIAEHADTLFSVPALARHGIRGWVLQELITFAEQRDPTEKIAKVRAQMEAHRASVPESAGLKFAVTPHATWTVDEATLRSFAGGPFFSIHLAETMYETECFKRGVGPIAELFRSSGFEPPVSGEDVETTMWEWRLFEGPVQLVHCCAVNPGFASLLGNQVSVAWCPRSNQALGCPLMPLGYLDVYDIPIGIGMDSAASSGPIDMFAEIRAAWHSPSRMAKRINADHIWAMATTIGARSIGFEHWGKAGEPEDTASWITIRNASPTVEGLIMTGAPDQVAWL